MISFASKTTNLVIFTYIPILHLCTLDILLFHSKVSKIYTSVIWDIPLYLYPISPISFPEITTTDYHSLALSTHFYYHCTFIISNIMTITKHSIYYSISPDAFKAQLPYSYVLSILQLIPIWNLFLYQKKKKVTHNRVFISIL